MIKDVYLVLLLMQSPQLVLQLCLKVLYLSWEHSLSKLRLTFFLAPLTVSDLIKKNKNKPEGKSV